MHVTKQTDIHLQCYDRYMLEELGKAAEAVDRYEWGYSGPHDSGRYNDWPHATGFFGSYESFNSEYGRFFLEWYSSMLLKHGDKVLEAASQAFEGCTTRLAAKVRNPMHKCRLPNSDPATTV